jgi:hypothetical protein
MDELLRLLVRVILGMYNRYDARYRLIRGLYRHLGPRTKNLSALVRPIMILIVGVRIMITLSVVARTL